MSDAITQPAVLHVIADMNPAAGGPPVVVDRLASRASENGFTAKVLSFTMSDVEDESDGLYKAVMLDKGPAYLFAKVRNRLKAEMEQVLSLIHI